MASGGRLAIALAALLYGFITVGGRQLANLGLSLIELSLTIAFVPLLLGPMMALRRDLLPAFGSLPFFVLFGLAGALLQLAQFAALLLGVPVAVVALLLYSQPLWTIGLGRVVLAEPVTVRKCIAAGTGLVGVVILVAPMGGAASYSVAGLVAGVVAGIALSIWVICGRHSALGGNHPLTTTFSSAFFSTLWLLLLFLPMARSSASAQLSRLSPAIYWQHWELVGIFAVAAILLPNALAFWGMQREQASTTGILLLLEPLSAAALGYLLLGEGLGERVLIGGFLVLMSNYVVIGERAEPVG